jgi:hypothetical protein
MEELVAWLERTGVFAGGLQETWKTGKTQEEHRGYVILNHGPVKKLCNRGSLGVAIVLSPEARKGWEEAGARIDYFGPRIIATRLNVLDANGKTLVIFLVSAYAPVGAASKEERRSYYDCLQACIDACGKREILMMCTDSNSSVGVRNRHDSPFEEGRDQVRGPFGIDYQNNAGRDLMSLLGTNLLCLPSTFFKKKNYCTWINPCNKLGHQLDQIIVKQADFKRVRDSGRYGLQGKNSDHHPVRLKLAIHRSLKNNSAIKPKTRINRSLLKNEETESEFIDAVKEIHAELSESGFSHLKQLYTSCQRASKEVLTTDARQRPGWYEAGKTEIEPVIFARDAAQDIYNQVPSSANKEKLKRTRKEVKFEVDKASEAWHTEILERINNFNEGGAHRTPGDAWKAIIMLRQGKSVTKKISSMALRNTNGDMCKTPQENATVMAENLTKVFSKKGEFSPNAAAALKQANKTPYAWMSTVPSDDEVSKAIKKAGSEKSGADTKCPAEFYKALEKDATTRLFIRNAIEAWWTTGSYKYWKPPPTLPKDPAKAIAFANENNWKISFKPDTSRRRSKEALLYSLLEECATIKEVLGLRNTGFDEQQLLHRLATLLHKKLLVIHAPEDTSDNLPLDDDSDAAVYTEWEEAVLKLLAKSGDLSLCKNWRGICLLDIASKILSTVIVERMKIVQNDVGLEMQNGFKNGCGTIDGSFSLGLAMQKRKEHGLETWALFIDLVKAFDTVPRELLWDILRKYGMPDHFVNVIIRLHTNCKIKFTVGDIETVIDSLIGVRQGSCEGPVLFTFIIQAAIETMIWPVAKPQFCTRAGDKGQVNGVNHNRTAKRTMTTFDIWASLFADDCGVLFESRADLITGANYLFSHLGTFGLQMHIGRPDKSKTEALFCGARSRDMGDTSSFAVADGFISFTDVFKYLGSLISENLTSDADVDKRIRSAVAAFGALDKAIFSNKRINIKTRGQVYQALVLTILLYGSECWCLTEKLFNRLRSFHRKNVRKMCNITMRHTIKHHIKTKDLLKRLGLKRIDEYYNTRLLRWAGHVARMGMTRTPRKLMTGWVPHTRPVGRPFMTWGQTLNKALKANNISTTFATWTALAQDRQLWREATTTTRTPDKRKPSSARQATAPAAPVPLQHRVVGMIYPLLSHLN